MRKLKTLLVMLFAASLSLALFACGGGEEENPTPGGSNSDINLIRASKPIELDDEDSKSALDAALQNYSLTVRNGLNENTTIKGSDCEVTANNLVEDKNGHLIVDDYSITLKPKANNGGNRTVDVRVVVDHAWTASGTEGKEICSYDHATRVTKDENIAIHYGTFHDGTANTNSTAINASALSADEISTYGLSAETTNGKVFNDAAGFNGAAVSSGRVKAFGMDYSAGGEVPTVTAGELLPGMSITIKGYARTDAGTAEKDGPWNTENKNWNAPSYGIADPYSTQSSELNKGRYNGGDSIIVRSEGWVLYDGIGLGPCYLGGLPAFVTGAKATNSGAKADGANYGSHPDDNGEKWPTGFNPNDRPAFTSEDWPNYWVYSEGTGLGTLADYVELTPVEVTWTYRTYDEGKVGIIIIDSVYNESSTLRSYIKVPDPTRGFYQTIIHGDFSSLYITETAVVETETVTDMQVSGVKQGEFLAGQQISASDNIVVQIQSENNPEWHTYSINNDMLYYYTGSANTVAAAKADFESDETDANWEVVGNKALTTDMKVFMVKFERSDRTWKDLVLNAEGTESAITVISNNVIDAYSDAYDDKLTNRDQMAAYTIGLTKVENTNYVTLTPVDYGTANGHRMLLRAIPEGSDLATAITGASGSAADYRYTVIRLVGSAAFTVTGHDSGSASDNSYIWKAKADGDDVLIAIALKEEALGKPIDIADLNATPIRIVYSEALGFEVISTVTGNDPTLDAGGTFTIKYNYGTDENPIVSLRVFSGSTAIGTVNVSDLADLGSGKAIGESGFTVTAYTAGDKEVTVTYKAPAFDYSWTEMPSIRAYDRRSVLAQDYVQYNFSFSGDAGEHETLEAGNKVYFYTDTAGENLYLVSVKGSTNTGIPENLLLTLNAGDSATAKAYDLSYEIRGTGAAEYAEFKDTAISADAFALSVNKYSWASGAFGTVVTVQVNLAEAGGFAGDFGFEINSAAQPDHYWWFNSTDKKIEYKALTTSGLTRELLEEGDCYHTGIAAYVVEDEGVSYLAGYTEIGGNHKDDDEDDTCDLCGEKINQFALTGSDAEVNSWKWSNDSLYMKNVKLGDVYDFECTFEDDPTYLYGNVGIVAAFRADTHLYWMRTDGWMKRSVHDVWTDEQLPTSPEDQYMSENEGKTNADLWTDLPYNTLNGVVDLKGNSIDTMVEANFESWIANKTLRIIARVMKNEAGQNTVDVEWRFYDTDGTLVLNYHQGFKVDDLSTLSIGINYDTNMNVTKAQYVKASTNKSAIESIENTAVTVGQPGTQYDALDLEFTENGFDDAGNVVVKVDGVAGKKDAQRYVTVKVTFASALAETTCLSVLTADGDAFDGAVATLDGARTSMTVYVPVTPDTGKFIVKIVNYEAYTLQSDVLFDLTNLAVSDATASVTGYDSVTLAGGTFNMALTGVNGDDTLVIGDATKKLSEITTSDADLGNGLKVKAQTVIGSGTSVTLVFTRTAADLGAKIPAYEIRIMRGTQLLAHETLDPAIAIGEYGVQIDATDWYARAEGTKLYVFGASTGTALKLNVNAGDVTFDTDPTLLGVSDFTFTVGNGAVKFETNSILSAVTTAVYTASGESGLTAFAIELTSLGVTASTVYGFEIEGGTNAYSVAATTREITHCAQGSSAKTVRASSCTVDGINAVAYKDNATTETVTEATFYGAIEIVKGAHTFPEEGGNCTVCGQVAGWRVDDVQVGKTDNSQGWLGGGLEHGTQKAYNPTGKNSSIVKGQKITASGVVTSSVANSYNGIAILFYPGNNFETYGTMHIRGDAWINGIGNRTGGVDETSNLRYAITAKVNDGNYADATYMAIAKKANATIVWDWTDESKVVITYTLAGIETEGSYVMTVTIMPEYEVFKEARYSIGITPDGGSFVGSIECICAKDFGASVNLEKAAEAHVHSYNTKDRCTADNTLKPDHNHTYVQGVCSVCDDVCKHTNVSGTECQDCHATLTSADSTISTTTPDNYWGNDTAVSTTTIEAGKTYVYTAQYEASQGTNVWRGAILKTTVGASLYSLRYIDGWHPDGETEVHSLNLKGGNYNYDTNAKGALDGTYMKVVVELANGTLTITLTQYASTDSAMATPQATRIMTISGIADEAVGFGIANGDGTHFVNNQVKLSIISYTWAN